MGGLFRLAVQVFSRGKGASAIAAAAYRAAARLVDLHGGVHDYLRRGGVVWTGILTPSSAPDWATNRQGLWAGACKAEKRKNAAEAREYLLTIPRELDQQSAIRLALTFAQFLVERYGIAVDVCVHSDRRIYWDGQPKDFQSFHVHLLTTTRQLNETGFGKKTRVLDDLKSGEIGRLRAEWARVANDALAEAGLATRLDHRSNRARGISRAPTKPLGPVRVALERRGIRTTVGDANRQLLHAFVTGLRLRPQDSVIDTFTTVEAALRARDAVASAWRHTERKAQKLLCALTVESTVDALEEQLAAIEARKLTGTSVRHAPRA